MSVWLNCLTIALSFHLLQNWKLLQDEIFLRSQLLHNENQNRQGAKTSGSEFLLRSFPDLRHILLIVHEVHQDIRQCFFIRER